MSDSQIRVRKLAEHTEADLDNIAKVFASAFKDEDDALALVMVGGDSSLLYELERVTVACVAKAGGEFWVASYGDQDFASAASWLPPGRVLLDSPDQQDMFNEFFQTLKPELRNWWMETFLPRYEAITEEVLGKDGKQPVWNLMTIGTLRDVRRRGLASALVQTVAKKVRETNELITVEAALEDNLKFYASLGWKIINERNPGYIDDMDGKPIPLWVITSVRDEQP